MRVGRRKEKNELESREGLNSKTAYTVNFSGRMLPNNVLERKKRKEMNEDFLYTKLTRITKM